LIDELLVADDSSALRKRVADALQRFGLARERVTLVDEADDAPAVFTPLSPDLVLVDAVLPRRVRRSLEADPGPRHRGRPPRRRGWHPGAGWIR
jgi:CheY-like chemotaxis protein